MVAHFKDEEYKHGAHLFPFTVYYIVGNTIQSATWVDMTIEIFSKSSISCSMGCLIWETIFIYNTRLS